MLTDIVADALARIKNGVMRKSQEVEVQKSNLIVAVLKVLKKEEFILDYKETETGVTVTLAYDDGEPVVENFKKMSKPGQRVYYGAKDLKPVMNGRGVAIISTSQGVMTGAMAKSRGLGGEIICNIW
jgi:small subunit ribosomal protein S8